MERVVNKDGEKESFDERKLYASVFYPAREAEYDREDAEELANEVCEAVKDWFRAHEDNVLTTREIRDMVDELLVERHDEVAFLYRTHLDIN